METRLSPSQAAHILETGGRTLRRWSNLFEKSLSAPARRKGRKRYYSGEDIETLRLAQKMMADGMSLADVATSLPVVAADSPTTAVVLAPEQSMAIGRILEHQDNIDKTLGEQSDDIGDLQEWRTQMKQWRELPWLQRIFRPPPA